MNTLTKTITIMKLFLTFIISFVGLSSVAQTFSPQNSGVSSQLNGLDFSSPSVGMVVGNSGVIRKTTDAGLTWTTSTSGTTYDLTGIAFLSGSTYIAVGKGGTVIKTTNGGGSWSPGFHERPRPDGPRMAATRCGGRRSRTDAFIRCNLE